ncbi:DUF362 domain-containing protein [bacterium]|nr:DUF362 domain-containing protein [bacterium]
MAADVYFVPVQQGEATESVTKKVAKLVKAAGMENCIGANDLTAIKIHFGEDKNTTHIQAEWTRPVVEAVKEAGASPFLTDTCVLYKSRRDNAVEHLRLAADHGFVPEVTGAPVVIADGLVGDDEREVAISGRIFDTVSLAKTVLQANSLVVMSHVTGHLGTGMGAALKNLGMGCASRKGKLRQHSISKPVIKAKFCTGCGECIKWCPADAITMTDRKAAIARDICIGCGECITVCRFGAVKHDWGIDAGELQRRVAEHALGAVSGKKDRAFYLNFLVNVTRECDCMDREQTPSIENIGILAGLDPVALDSASLALLTEKAGDRLDDVIYADLDASLQLAHGEAIGLGGREYRLLTIE